MDENEFEFEGKVYVAMKSNHCDGCAFDTIGVVNETCFMAKCHPSERSIGDSVIFVEKHP
ncbi:MAG: hypothetical protein ACRDBQ_15140 [Shewanella sp.]